MIRTIALGTLLAAALAGTAFAQGSYHHHSFCLQVGSSKECAYDTMAQCEAAKHGPRDTCVPNSAPVSHPQ